MMRDDREARSRRAQTRGVTATLRHAPDNARQRHLRFVRFNPNQFYQLMLLVLVCVGQGACGGASRAARAPETTTDAATARNVTRAMDWRDADGDGLPDGAELRSFNDRENFRRWFTGIAEMQYEETSDWWNAEQRDCAGLVRFAWREALRRHDRRWLQKMGAAYEAFAPDVRAYDAEHPPLGGRLFRTVPGSFQMNDREDETFSEFADARTLKEFNTEFVSRDRNQAQAGDLLFFHQGPAQKYPYHVMIFLGVARTADESANDWVVYHTGTSPGDKGTVKKVRLHVLDEHPDKRWRPVASNRNFLGFYRLKMLR